MADLAFNTTAGETMARELLLLCLNTGTANSPTWSPCGKRTTDSSMEIDWNEETNTDVLGVTRTSLKNPQRSQTFDPVPLDSGDSATVKIWNLAFHDQDPHALAAQDFLLVHLYATSSSSTFAERFPSSAVIPTGLGGEGGGDLGMPYKVVFGGERVTGTASRDSTTGAITFTPDSN
ncbi:MAG: hypothetical protein IKG69_11835 [Atopobiaceae bacterium]|nr:hypothetical protein [Atopobiaceae bacterium]